MLIAFQIILLLVIFISFVYIVGNESISSTDNLTIVCVVSILSFLVTVIWL